MAKDILQRDVYATLRDQIISWQRPPGEALREEQLAAEFHVSRTPLREALRKLADEGLVDYVPHKGARVARMSPVLIQEVFMIREALEGVAAREAATRLDPATLSRLRDRFEALRTSISKGDLQDVGDEIHDLMLASSGSERLEGMMSTIMGQVKWLQRAAERFPERLQRSFREHENILTALEAGDPQAAESAARAHVRSTLKDLLAYIQARPEAIRSRSR